jgi:glycine betaine catabolism A
MEQTSLRPDIIKLIQSRKPGFSLPQPLYTAPEFYALEIEKIWKRYWVFVGHVSQIPKPGSYFLYQLGSDPIIIMRGDDGREVHALLNVCRHRGSIILSEPCGETKKLVCPYHQWVFDRDGALRAAKLMPDDLDKSEYSMFRVHCQVLEGFIFISLAENPLDFSLLEHAYLPHMQMYNMERTKLAYLARYRVKSNWKLIAENFRECYHCGVGHPEYCSVIIGANLLKQNEQVRLFKKDRLNDWAAKNVPVHLETFEANRWYYCERYPYQPGFQTMSMDGSLLAPPLGELKDVDVGVFSIVQYPNFWLDINNDYAWTMRITPIAVNETEIEAGWLVHEDAVEGRDYDLEKLIYFWKTTAEQDWKLCEDNHAGVSSSYYRPGPYSSVEGGPEQFDTWYLEELCT